MSRSLITIKKETKDPAETIFSDFDHYELCKYLKSYTTGSFCLKKHPGKYYEWVLVHLKRSDDNTVHYAVAQRILCNKEMNLIRKNCKCCLCESSYFNPIRYLPGSAIGCAKSCEKPDPFVLAKTIKYVESTK